RRVVRAWGRAGAPQAPLLQITTGPAHNRNDPIDIDSKSEDFTGGETEEETEAEVSELGGEENSDPEWHDTQDILQVERAEQSAERVTLVSEEPPSQDLCGEDESIAGCYVVPDTRGAHQLTVAFVSGADPRDPSWRPGDPKTANEWRDLIHHVCTDTLMIPMERTCAELLVDAREPSAAGRHTKFFPPVWHVAKMVTLHTELTGYRTTELLMRSRSHREAAAAPRDREPSVHSERQHSR
ncbi:hypothetical protein KI387_009257, partial [Taxus chinensis]